VQRANTSAQWQRACVATSLCQIGHLDVAPLVENGFAAIRLQKVGIGPAADADIHLVGSDGASAGRQPVLLPAHF